MFKIDVPIRNLAKKYIAIQPSFANGDWYLGLEKSKNCNPYKQMGKLFSNHIVPFIWHIRSQINADLQFIEFIIINTM